MVKNLQITGKTLQENDVIVIVIVPLFSDAPAAGKCSFFYRIFYTAYFF